MPALPDTMTRERAGRSARAILACALSCSPSIHNQQNGRGTHNPRAHFGGYGHHCDVSPCELAPVSAGVPFTRVPHWSRSPSLLAVTNRGVELSRLPRVNSVNRSRSTAPVRNRLPHQRLVNHTVERLHHLSSLSSSPSFDGFKTIWKAFADGRISFGGQQIVFPR